MDPSRLHHAAIASSLVGVAAFAALTLMATGEFTLALVTVGVLAYGTALGFYLLYTATVVQSLLDRVDFSFQSRFEPR